MHKYILKKHAIAICTHCERALATEGILHRINTYDALLDAAEWVLKNAGYEKGKASDSLRELSISRHQLDALLAAVTEAKEK